MRALRERQVSGLARRQSFTPASAATAHRLALTATLGGHDGCVNRLAWDAAGQFLASVSDDRSIIVRPLSACCTGEGHGGADPATPSTAGAARVATRHAANIFGVEFLPDGGSGGGLPDRVVTGAMDGEVQVHSLGGGSGDSSPPSSPAAALRRRAGGGGGLPTGAPSTSLPTLRGATVATSSCHTGRVKHVAVTPDAPFCFFSASEDGTARLFDTRDPVLMPRSEGGDGGGRRPFNAPNVVASPVRSRALPPAAAAAAGRHPARVPLKAIAFCPARPWLFALAADDAFLRVYDRRTAGPGTPTAALGSAPGRAPLLALAPPHLIACPAAARGAAATFVAWSDDAGWAGPALLGNYSAAGVWRFDGVGGGGGGGDFSGTLPPPGWPPHAPPVPAGAAVPPAAWAWRAHPRRWPARPRPASSPAEPSDSDEEVAATIAGGGPAAAGALLASARALLDRGWAGDAWAAAADAAAAVHEARGGGGGGGGGTPAGAAAPPRVGRQALAALADALRALGVSEGGRAAAAAAAAAADGAGRGRQAGGGAAPAAAAAATPPPSAWVWEGAAAAAAAAAADVQGGAGAGAAPPGWPGGRLPSARYLGALNVQTDIKEARFWGSPGDPFTRDGGGGGGGGGAAGCVVAGSDDGFAFLWPAVPRAQGARSDGPPPLAALDADDDICNCVLPHPGGLPLLATAGLGDTVRVWAPGSGEEEEAEAEGAEGGGGRGGGRAGPGPRRSAITAPRELLQVCAANASLTAPAPGIGRGRGPGRGGPRGPPGSLEHARAAGEAVLRGGPGATIDSRDLETLTMEDPALLMAILQRAAVERLARRGRRGGGGGGGSDDDDDDDEGGDEGGWSAGEGGEDEGGGGQPQCRMA